MLTVFASSLSFSAAFRARSSLFLANLDSGTGLNVKSVLAQELNSPLFQCRRKLLKRNFNLNNRRRYIKIKYNEK